MRIRTARKALRRFSAQLIHLFAKWNAVPDPRLGLNLPLLRDIVFGSLEHIVWTAMVQRREDAIDVPKMSRDLAGAYLRAFGSGRQISDGAPRGREKSQRPRGSGAGRQKGESARETQPDARLTTGTRHTNSNP